MSSPHAPFEDLRILIEQAMTGRRDEVLIEKLEQRLAHDADARQFYLDYMDLHIGLGQDDGVLSTLGRPLHGPAGATADETAGRLGARRQRERRRAMIAFSSAFTLAAMLIFSMMAYLQFLWDHPAEPVLLSRPDARVARLLSTENAIWESDIRPEQGEDLTAGRLKLKTGLAEIRFNGGATVILQGPVDFEVRTAGSAFLHHGRVAAHAPQQAAGFTIGAEGMHFIDLGTAFGLEITDQTRHTELHVFEGRVRAEIGEADQLNHRRLELRADEATRIDGKTGTVETVNLDGLRFVRRMPPRPIDLDLSDIVAGGDGLGSGRHHGIDPSTGRLDAAAGQGRLWGDGRFHPTILSSYVDGAFIPDGSKGPTTLDSAGHTIALPTTSNGAQDLIRRGGTRDEREREANFPPVLGGIDYRAKGRTALGLHSNAGVTFDLAAIRNAHPDHHLDRFAAVVGVIDKGKSSGLADIRIYVDGALRFEQLKRRGDGLAIPIDLKLRDEDRFLTLITTDGGNGTGHDWVVYGDPRLRLEPLAQETPR